MKIQVTNQQIFNYHNEVSVWEGNSILFYFLNGKIQEFHNKNRIRITSMLDKYNAMMADHYVIEGGQIKMASEPYPVQLLTSEVTEEQAKWEREHPAAPILTGKTTQGEYEKMRDEFLSSLTTLEL